MDAYMWSASSWEEYWGSGRTHTAQKVILEIELDIRIVLLDNVESLFPPSLKSISLFP